MSLDDTVEYGLAVGSTTPATGSARSWVTQHDVVRAHAGIAASGGICGDPDGAGIGSGAGRQAGP